MTSLIKAWPSLEKRLKPGRTLVVLLDFDGTLAPIVARPEIAWLPARTRRALAELSRVPNVKLAVISGRALSDVRRRVALPGVVFVGNHGLEVSGPRLRWTHPSAQKYRAGVRAVALRLGRVARGVPGSQLEWKGLTASVHWRGVATQNHEDFTRRLRNAVNEFIKEDKARVTFGKLVMEIRPPIAWDKGTVIGWLMRRGVFPKDALLVMLGDDTTDEDAFRFVRSAHGVTVRVGPSKVSTAARYTLKDSVQVCAWLQRVARSVGGYAVHPRR